MEKKKNLIILNNKSGKGNALNIYNKFIKNEFTNKNSKLLKISYFGMFTEFVSKNLEYINHLKSLVIMGGDGTIHTICNTLLSHNINIPIENIRIPNISRIRVYGSISFAFRPVIPNRGSAQNGWSILVT